MDLSPWQPVAIVHLALAGCWAGAMGYSLLAVQPKLARFVTDPRRREELVTVLAQGNRWRVLALVAGLLASGALVVGLAPRPVALGFAVALGCQLAATGVFIHVSWWHWPARVFALPEEVPGFARRLRRLALVMTGLVGVSFVVGLAVGVGVGGG